MSAGSCKPCYCIVLCATAGERGTRQHAKLRKQFQAYPPATSANWLRGAKLLLADMPNCVYSTSHSRGECAYLLLLMPYTAGLLCFLCPAKMRLTMRVTAGEQRVPAPVPNRSMVQHIHILNGVLVLSMLCSVYVDRTGKFIKVMVGSHHQPQGQVPASLLHQ